MIRLRKAKLSDIAKMQRLVLAKVADGTILKREDDEVATNIRSYVIALDDEEIVGYGALHIHSPRLAEIRSLIVEEGYRKRHIGQSLVEFTLDEAKSLGIEEVLVLTYIRPFFEKLGFVEIPKESIPEHKIWADCIKCIHFPICDEISLVYRIES
ncbi:MAG: N-acetyltransferase [Campylobacterales bacterium]|nr:N-acetyltransferase [Campylobacterales bacterium]